MQPPGCTALFLPESPPAPLPRHTLCCHPVAICFSTGTLARSPLQQTTPHTPSSAPYAGSDPERHPSTTPARAPPTHASPHLPAPAPLREPQRPQPAVPPPSPAAPPSARASTAPARRSKAPGCCTATTVPAPQGSVHPEFASNRPSLLSFGRRTGTYTTYPATRSGCPMHRTRFTLRCMRSTLPKANHNFYDAQAKPSAPLPPSAQILAS